MLDITVKTLDGRNRTFSVPDNITVRQFKEKISTSIEIDADTQRLIFQGRVLVDEKKIDDYNVNGKTIHVVQKPPPSAQSAVSAHSEASPSRNREEVMRQEGNTFVLGSFSMPAVSADATAHVRNVVHQMLSGLGNINHGPHVAAQTSGHGQPSVDVHVNVGHGSSLQNFESQNHINQSLQMLSSVAHTINRLDNAGNDEAAGSFQPMSGISSGSQNTEGDAGIRQPSPAAPQSLSLSVLSSLLDEVLRLHDRLRPHLLRYRQLLNDDPDFTNRGVDIYSAQRLCNLSSEALHFLSHSYHHISDLIVDLSPPPPRQLRAQSTPSATIVQQTLPVQINVAHVPVSSASGLGQSQQNAPAASAAIGDQNTQSTAGTANASGGPTSSENLPNSHRASANSSMPIAAPGIPPGFHVFMEMAPGPNMFGRPWAAPGMSPLHAEAATMSPQLNNGIRLASGGTPTASGALFPPGDFLQNVIHMAATAALRGQPGQQVTGVSSASSTNPTQSTATNTAEQRDQNTPSTLTTTSTSVNSTLSSTSQTQRLYSHASTASSIPSIQPLMPAPTNELFPIDPYLPCSSRHFLGHHPMRMTDRNTTAQNTGQGLDEVVSNLVSSIVQPFARSVEVGISSPGMSNPVGSPAPNIASLSSSNLLSTTDGIQSSLREATGMSQTSGATDVFGSMMQGIASELLQTLHGQSHQSIAEFLSQLGSEYTMPQGEGFLADLFHIVAGQLAFTDLMTVFFGQPGPLECLREPLRQFIVSRVLNGEEATDDRIDHAVDLLMGDMLSDISAFAQEIPTRNRIDYPATVTRFIRIHLHSAIHLIMNTTAESGFAASLYELCRTVVHGYVGLSRHCLVGGQAALEDLLQERLQSITAEVNPAMQSTMSQVAVQQLRQIEPCLTEDNLTQYIVYQSSSPVATKDSESSDSSFQSACDDAAADSITLDEQLKAIDTANGDQMSLDVNVEMRPTRISPTLLSYLSAPPTVDSDSDVQIVCGNEDWHSAIPTAWIPVITRDIVRQRRHAPQAALSDAYLSGMPLKRRRIMTRDRHREEFSELVAIIPEVINRAADQAGVRPVTSQNEMHRDILDNTHLCAAFQQQLNETIHQRLSSDSDYIVDKYPNADRCFSRTRNM